MNGIDETVEEIVNPEDKKSNTESERKRFKCIWDTFRLLYT